MRRMHRTRSARAMVALALTAGTFLAATLATSAVAGPQTKWFTATVGSASTGLSSSVLYPANSTGRTLFLRLTDSPTSNQSFGSADVDLVQSLGWSVQAITTVPAAAASAWSSTPDANGHVFHLRNSGVGSGSAIPPTGYLQLQITFDSGAGGLITPGFVVKQSNDFSDSSRRGTSNIFGELTPVPSIIIGAGPPAKIVYTQVPTAVRVTSASTGTNYMCPAVTAAVEDVDGNVVSWLPHTAVTLSSTGLPGLKLGSSSTLSADTVSGVATFGDAACDTGLNASNQGTFDLKASTTVAAGTGYAGGAFATATPEPTFNVYLQTCDATCNVNLPAGNQTKVNVDATNGTETDPLVGFISPADFAPGCDPSISYRPEQTTLLLEGHDKTVDIGWSKKVTNQDPLNGTPFWPVCIAGPYDVYAVQADGSVGTTDATDGAMLAPCDDAAVTLRTDGQPDAPCIADLYKSAASEHAVIWLPNLPGDPRVW